MVKPEDLVNVVDKESNEIVSFLRDIIRIPSVTGEEGEIQRFISSYLKEFGIKLDIFEPDLNELKKHPAYVPVERDYKGRPNVVGILEGSGQGRSIILNGHVDVIPAGPRENWSVDPWGGEIIGESIYGRGASDMKSGIAAMTGALKIIAESGIKLKGKIISEYVVDEELSGHGTLACVLRGYRADGGINLETSSMKLQPASIGRIWYEISVKGKPAGIQNRRNGVNAIDLAYKLKLAIDAYEANRISTLSHPLFPNKEESLPCMVGEFHAGTYPSAFPDTCILRGSLATLPNEDSKRVKDDFMKYLIEVARQDPWMRQQLPDIKYKGYFAEPAEISTEHPLVKTISNAYRFVLKKEPEISGRNGAADIRLLIKYGNTPSIVFGPGDTLQMHATDERVKIEDVINATKILIKTILDWVGYE